MTRPTRSGGPLSFSGSTLSDRRSPARLLSHNRNLEGQFYLMGIAGLGVSLAGFASLLTLFRAPHTWDGVTLWRARIIVRASLDTAR